MNKYSWQFVLYLWLYILIFFFFAGEDQIEDGKKQETIEIKKEKKIDRVKRAAVTAISAVAVKAKLLANQEEDQIRQLAAFLIEKQVIFWPNKLSYMQLIVDFVSLTLWWFPFVAVA